MIKVLKFYLRTVFHKYGYCHWVDGPLFVETTLTGLDNPSALLGQECSICSSRRAVWENKSGYNIPTPYDDASKRADIWLKELV